MESPRHKAFPLRAFAEDDDVPCSATGALPKMKAEDEIITFSFLDCYQAVQFNHACQNCGEIS